MILLPGKKIFFLLVVPIVFVLSSINVFSQTTFSGTGNWSDAARWSSGIPGSSTAAVIAANASCTINSSAVCGSLTLNNNSRVMISGMNSLTVSGAVVINNTANQAVSLLNTGSGSLLGNSLSINGGNGQRKAELSIGSGSVNILTNINFSGSQSNSNALIRFTGNGNLSLGGNLGEGGVIIPGSGTVVFNGNTPQAIQDTALTNFYNLHINNPAGVVLNGNLYITNTLSFINGNLLTDSNSVTLGENSILAGEGEMKYLVGNVSISKTVGAGQSDNFAGIGVSLGSGTDDLGTVTIKRVSGAAGKISAGGNEGINRKWIISSVNQPLNGRVISFSWVADDDNSVDLSSAVVFKSADGISQWETIGISQDVSVNRTITITTNSFSYWTVGDITAPLPVELSSFTGYSSGNNVFLEWRTGTELQNYGFEVQMSRRPEDNLSGNKQAGPEWQKIGFVKGYGNSNVPRDYSFTYNTAETGRYSYRLKQIDNDGKYKFSSEVELKINELPSGFTLEQNYPNPFNPVTNIKFSVDKTSYAVLKLYDMLGEEVKVLFNETAENGKVYSVDFNAVSGGSLMASGVYFYSLNNGHQQIVRKMILAR